MTNETTENDQICIQEVDLEIGRQKDLDKAGGQGLQKDTGDHQTDQADTAILQRDLEDLQRGREDLRLQINETDATGPDLDHLEIGTNADPDLLKSQENDRVVDPETKTINTNLISNSKSRSHEVTTKMKLIRNRQLRKLEINLRVKLNL